VSQIGWWWFVMRSDGRVTYAEFLPDDVKHPIILHWVTKLTVKHHHEFGNHNSCTNQIISSLSTRFWIITTREAAIEECMMCQWCKTKAAQQIMAPLPLKRFSTSLKAFTKTALDRFSWQTIDKADVNHREKVFVLVYMSSNKGSSFRNSIWTWFRFLSKCLTENDVHRIKSGINFVVANKEMSEIMCKDSRVQSSMANMGD